MGLSALLSLFWVGFGLWMLTESTEVAEKSKSRLSTVILSRILLMCLGAGFSLGISESSGNWWLAILITLTFAYLTYASPTGYRKHNRQALTPSTSLEEVYDELSKDGPRIVHSVYAELPIGKLRKIEWLVEPGRYVSFNDPIARLCPLEDKPTLITSVYAGTVTDTFVSVGEEVQNGTLIARMSLRTT